MVISFYGEGCFKISARGGSAAGGQSGDFAILTDPFDNKSGLTPPRFKADIILKTFTPLPITNNQQSAISNVIVGPGEYDVKDVGIIGFGLKKESSDKFLKAVYLIKIEGVKLCFLGHLSGMPDPEIEEHLEEIDILFIPAGGKPFINQETAVKLIKQIEPKVVVPSFFKIPGLKRPSADLKFFLEEFNYSKQTAPREKLVVKKRELTEIKKTELVVLGA